MYALNMLSELWYCAKVNGSGSPGNISGKIYHLVLTMPFLCPEKEETDKRFVKIGADFWICTFFLGGLFTGKVFCVNSG